MTKSRYEFIIGKKKNFHLLIYKLPILSQKTQLWLIQLNVETKQQKEKKDTKFLDAVFFFTVNHQNLNSLEFQTS